MQPYFYSYFPPPAGPVTRHSSGFSGALSGETSNVDGISTNDLFKPSGLMRPEKAIGFFILGIISVLGLRGAVKRFSPKISLPPAPQVNQHQTILSLNNLSSFLVQAFQDSALRGTFIAYIVATIGGYLTGTLAQGVKETWVRRQETKIRAHLLTRLNRVFQKSLQTKHAMDSQLKQDAKRQIAQLLRQTGINDIEAILWEQPIAESLEVNRRYFFEPTHRTLPSSQLRFGEEISRPRFPLETWISAGMFTLGALGTSLVLAIKSMMQCLTPKKLADLKEGVNSKVIQSMMASDLQGLLVLRDKRIIGSFLALSSLATIGKLLLDGLREIEVTRANASTEFDYQSFNWLCLDPSFHKTAEQQALEIALQRLQQHLPYLRSSPQRLRHEVQTLLTNVGRNSAPPYFPMTPAIGLVDARG